MNPDAEAAFLAYMTPPEADEYAALVDRIRQRNDADTFRLLVYGYTGVENGDIDAWIDDAAHEAYVRVGNRRLHVGFGVKNGVDLADPKTNENAWGRRPLFVYTVTKLIQSLKIRQPPEHPELAAAVAGYAASPRLFDSLRRIRVRLYDDPDMTKPVGRITKESLSYNLSVASKDAYTRFATHFFAHATKLQVRPIESKALKSFDAIVTDGNRPCYAVKMTRYDLPIPMRLVLELKGRMLDSRAPGVFVATSRFTDAATAAAEMRAGDVALRLMDLEEVYQILLKEPHLAGPIQPTSLEPVT